MYLQQSLKEGSATSSIEGLSRSGEHYGEAIEYLKSRYDRPRLIHQAHVRLILEAPPLREGTGKELRRLHDVVTQHLRALKSMDYDPSGPFITSVLELKLDTTTLFEWQRHSQSETDVPHYKDLLAFIDLRAQATEGSTAATVKKPKSEYTPFKKIPTTGMSVASYASHHETVSNQCVLCQDEKYPLYTCPKFKPLVHDKNISLLKYNNLCMNCISGQALQICTQMPKCQKPHHTLLHVDRRSEDTPIEDKVSSHTAVKLKPISY